MPAPDPNAPNVIDYFKRKVDAALAKVADWQRSANEIAAENGLPPVYATIIDGGAAGMAIVARADQFANYAAPGVAARAYLESRKQLGATTLDDIFKSLKDGGYQFSDSDSEARGGLKIALGKDAKVRTLSNGTYGLWEWYPDAKRPKAGKINGGGGGASEDEEEPEEAEPTA